MYIHVDIDTDTDKDTDTDLYVDIDREAGIAIVYKMLDIKCHVLYIRY